MSLHISCATRAVGALHNSTTIGSATQALRGFCLLLGPLVCSVADKCQHRNVLPVLSAWVSWLLELQASIPQMFAFQPYSFKMGWSTLSFLMFPYQFCGCSKEEEQESLRIMQNQDRLGNALFLAGPMARYFFALVVGFDRGLIKEDFCRGHVVVKTKHPDLERCWHEGGSPSVKCRRELGEERDGFIINEFILAVATWGWLSHFKVGRNSTFLPAMEVNANHVQ